MSIGFLDEIPGIGGFLDDGSTEEEWKMVVETKKILDPKIKVNATCVRVPVFVAHSESINSEFERARGWRAPGGGSRSSSRSGPPGRPCRCSGS